MNKFFKWSIFMKKLLAIALMAVYPLFGDVKSDNARLLAHLKMVKAEYILKRIPTIEIHKHRPSSSEGEYYKCLFSILHDFYNKSEILQKIITEQIAQPEFDLICNNIEPVAELMEKMEKLPVRQKMVELIRNKGWDHLHESINIPAKEKQKLLKLFVPIFKKSFRNFENKVAKMFENGFLDGKDSSEGMKNWFHNFLNHLICDPHNLGKDWPLLKMVDAKIAELEAQA